MVRAFSERKNSTFPTFPVEIGASDFATYILSGVDVRGGKEDIHADDSV